MKKSSALSIGHFVLLQAIWPAAVMGAVHGYDWIAAPVLLAMLLWSRAFGAPLRPDLRMAVCGVVIGMVVEIVLMGLHLIHYRLQPAPGWPPVWILILWAGFALNMNHCLAWMQGRWRLAALLGALGSPWSVLAGIGMGAAQAPSGAWALGLAYSLAWAIVLPLLSSLAMRFRIRDQLEVRDHGGRYLV